MLELAEDARRDGVEGLGGRERLVRRRGDLQERVETLGEVPVGPIKSVKFYGGSWKGRTRPWRGAP